MRHSESVQTAVDRPTTVCWRYSVLYTPSEHRLKSIADYHWISTKGYQRCESVRGTISSVWRVQNESGQHVQSESDSHRIHRADRTDPASYRPCYTRAVRYSSLARSNRR